MSATDQSEKNTSGCEPMLSVCQPQPLVISLFHDRQINKLVACVRYSLQIDYGLWTANGHVQR